MVLAGWLIMLTGCTIRTQQQSAPAPLRVKTLVVSEQNGAGYATYVGEVEEVRQTDMGAETAGRVAAIHVRQGEHVKVGQPLLDIDATQANNALQAAEATMREARDGYERVQRVHQSGVVSDQKMIEIESRYQQAEAALQLARQRVEQCHVKAPAGGVIGVVRVQTGEYVLPGAPLITILDVNDLLIRFAVPENEVSQLLIGDTGRVVVEASGLPSLPLRITDKQLQADRLSHTYSVGATIGALSAAQRQQLLPGMIAKVLWPNGQKAGVVIPAHCIRLKPDGHSVWIQKDGCATKRDVVPGDYLHNGIVITEGLQPGDTLILEGYQKLYEGATICTE